MEIDPTTRAYTVNLIGDGDWRQQLWSTHLAVNRGVWTWGEWLLTLRGGLPASLADGHPERRVLLALSWLSVESPASLVRASIVATSTDKNRDEKVLMAFRTLLPELGVRDVESWEAACKPALTARLRDDAVWVNRHAAFVDLKKSYRGIDNEWVSRTLFEFLGGEEAYFKMPNDANGNADEAKDFVQKAGGWLSRNWGSGSKSDASSIAESLHALADVESSSIVGLSGAEALRSLLESVSPNSQPALPNDAYKTLKQMIGWKGRSSKGAIALEKLTKAAVVDATLWEQTKNKLLEEAESQVGKAKQGSGKPTWMDAWRSSMESLDGIGMPFRTTRDLIWEHGVMLDHALRRVSSAHTWIKRAEAERQKFEKDALKRDSVPDEVRQWLDAFCRDRAEETGGDANDYVIRKAAFDGWEKIVDAWGELSSIATVDERVAAARNVQSNVADDDKFGDMTLFERLAADGALRVWQGVDGESDPTILRNYSEAAVADFNRRRFKVPAYRHPDPLRNPVYADFGASRWSISYSALAETQKRSKLRQKLVTAKTDSAKANVRAELDEKPKLRNVTLGLWTGGAIQNVTLRWQGKRLWKDLDLDHFDAPADATVTRADRLGRAAQKSPAGAVTVADVFAAKDWNGRLQIPRKQLDRLANLVYGAERIERDGKSAVNRAGADYAKLRQLPQNDRASKMFDSLKWFLTTSAKLKPSGPIWDFVEGGLPAGIAYKKRRTGWCFDYAKNKGREGRARLLLAEIPGLRVLSYDYGVRHAAACAVWETLTQRMLENEITTGRDVVAGGVSAEHLFLHTEHTGTDGKPRRTIYRRTAPDMWARLERQFLIKLQGEDRVARRAHPEEQRRFDEFQRFLGMRPLSETWRIDELQSEAIRLARRGLRRLGDVARIAYAMTARNRPLSGGRNSAEFTRDERVAYLQEKLYLWQQLAQNPEYEDTWARETWQNVVVQRLDGPQPNAQDASPTDSPHGLSKSRSRQKKEAAIEPLRGVAEQIADHDSQLATELRQQWSDRYCQLENEWKLHLRWLRRLILPRKKEFATAKERIRNVGGLSVKRLQTIRGLYETMRSFRMRPEPDDLQKNIPELREESLKRFGRRILDQLERMREQRIKQLASRIVEGALGAGRVAKPRGRDRKRPQTLVDIPCHVVVAEDLEHYKPEESRLRRENRRLMDWAARNIRKHVVDGCQLNGLHFVEVSPAYTSRQDSRTGAPGIRCEEVSATVLAAAAGAQIERPTSTRLQRQISWLSSELNSAKAAQRESKANPRQRVLLSAIQRLSSSPKPLHLVRLPRHGGELFVSANPESPAAKGLQADLNAAANIGLKALMHPDYIGSWCHVLVNRATGRPELEKVKGCSLSIFLPEAKPLSKPVVEVGDKVVRRAVRNSGKTAKKKSPSRKKTSVYAWNPLHIGSTAVDWPHTTDHQQDVENRVANFLIQNQSVEETPW